MINDNELAKYLRRALNTYYRDLDGEQPRKIYEMVMYSVEKPLIETILQKAEGNQTQAAEILGINRNTLRKKIKLHKIK